MSKTNLYVPGKAPCLGCGKALNPKHTLCAACAEDMGYARRAR